MIVFLFLMYLEYLAYNVAYRLFPSFCVSFAILQLGNRCDGQAATLNSIKIYEKLVSGTKSENSREQ